MSSKKAFSYTLMLLVVLVVFFYINRSSEVVRTAYENGQDLLQAMDGIGQVILERPLYLSLNQTDLLVPGFVLTVLLMFIMRRRKVFRLGEEYGSARWGTAADIKPFIDPDPYKNIILTQTERLSMAGRMKVTKAEDYNRNKNVLVIGGAGTGKTRYYVKPNLLQCHSSYVITDPKGLLLYECGHALESQGYAIKVLNLDDTWGMRKSMGYNPFVYIHSEADILKVVDVFMANTGGGDKKEMGDPFWQAAERLFYCALIAYIWSVGEPEDRNFCTLLDLLNASDAREEDEDYQSPVDILFRDLEKDYPSHFAVRQYKKFRKAAGKTAKSILISCAARLAPFDIQEVRDLMTTDELELDLLGDEKTALFVITSDTNKTFNFIAALAYSQMFNLLCNRADHVHGGRLPVHVRCLFDEFANIGRIPNFDEIISVIRSREISANVILQSKAQLESVYEKKTDIIVDNCDSLLFLGGKGKMLEDVVKLIGKQTIDQFSESKTRGSQKSDGTNYQKLGRELLTVDELAVMSRKKCICQIGGIRPFYSDKYNLPEHPRYKLLSDADERNTYIPPWMPRQPLDISLDEGFEIFE